MTKKFWCHYIGSDGNTPKRRNIELTNLADILPTIDNTHCKTPLWFEKETDQYNQSYYTLYAQLSDTVAVHIPQAGMSDRNLETMRSTDADIEATSKMWLDKFFAEYPNMSEERKQREREERARVCENDKKNRDIHLATLARLQDLDNYLLSGTWVNASMIRAYEEVKSPILLGLKELRAMALEEREAKRREREERDRLRREEEARKKAEEEAKEQERLTEEADRFRQGESISGSDVVDLCRRYGIAIHQRTVHNLQQVIANINGKDQTCHYYRTRGKRRPQLDGCYNTARELYDYLQAH